MNQRGWVPFHSMGLGPLAIAWREDLLQKPRSLGHPSAFYGTKHVWFCPTADQDLKAPRRPISVKLGTPSRSILVDTGAPKRSILVQLEGAGGPILVIFGPPSRPLSAPGRPSFANFGHFWGWVPLLFCGAGSPFIQWGWDPFDSVGLSTTDGGVTVRLCCAVCTYVLEAA